MSGVTPRNCVEPPLMRKNCAARRISSLMNAALTPSSAATSGDDIAEVFALLGVRPVWDDASRRVTGFEVTPLADLGRPRIDVTVRISRFFRESRLMKIADSWSMP